jgi:peptide/nickel transport system substrate-binding protein
VDSLLSGAVDFIVRVPDGMAAMLEADPDIELSPTWTTEWFYVMMDPNTPPWDDVRVRQAVSWAIDRDAVLETVCYGRGTPVYGGIIPSWHWAYSDLQTYRHQDLEKARQLLAEAGYPDGLDVTLGTASGFDFVIRLAEAVAAMLEEAGIRTEIEMTPVPEYFNMQAAGECTFCIGGESPAGDPDDFYFVYYHSQGDFNYNSYANPELDRLLEEGRRVSDLQQRKEIYRQVEEIVLEEAPVAHIVSPVAQEAYASYLKGYVHMGNRRLHGLMYSWLDQ